MLTNQLGLDKVDSTEDASAPKLTLKEKYDEKIENSIKASALSGREAVLFYITRFAELYENYSELTTVMFSFDLFFIILLFSLRALGNHSSVCKPKNAKVPTNNNVIAQKV